MVVKSPFLEVFKKQLEIALSALLNEVVINQGLDLVILEMFSNLNDSVVSHRFPFP